MIRIGYHWTAQVVMSKGPRKYARMIWVNGRRQSIYAPGSVRCRREMGLAYMMMMQPEIIEPMMERLEQVVKNSYGAK